MVHDPWGFSTWQCPVRSMTHGGLVLASTPVHVRQILSANVYRLYLFKISYQDFNLPSKSQLPSHSFTSISYITNSYDPNEDLTNFYEQETNQVKWYSRHAQGITKGQLRRTIEEARL